MGGRPGERAKGTFAMQVGANLARARRRAGLSQEDLGYRAALHRTAVGQLERGERVPRLDSALKLAQTLGVPMSVLVEGIDWELPQIASGGFSYPTAEQAEAIHYAGSRKARRRNNAKGNEAQ